MKIVMVPDSQLGRVNLPFLLIFIWMTIKEHIIIFLFYFISFLFEASLVGPQC